VYYEGSDGSGVDSPMGGNDDNEWIGEDEVRKSKGDPS
jgi:hypothetical protein